jgi:Tfp pilus assembly protein PilN
VPDEYMTERRRLVVQRRVRNAGILLALVYVVVLAGALSALGYQMSRLSSLESEAAGLKPAFDRVSSLRDDVQVLREYVTKQSPFLDILLELHRLKPERLFLTELNFADGDQIGLTGYAPSAAIVSELDGKLQKSALFPGGTNLSPLTDTKVRGEVMVRFQIVCKMKKSATHEEPGRRRGKRR